MPEKPRGHLIPTGELAPAPFPGRPRPAAGTVAAAGQKAAYRFLEFFTANIRNPNTRRAYYRNAVQFLDWAAQRDLSLGGVRSVHVAA